MFNIIITRYNYIDIKDYIIRINKAIILFPYDARYTRKINIISKKLIL